MVTRRTDRNEDYYQWMRDVAEEYEQEDTDLSEAILAMSRSEQKGVKAQLHRLMLHLVKYMCQPQMRTRSWYNTVRNAGIELRLSFEESPSLLHFLSTQDLQRMYRQSVSDAVDEMKPNAYMQPPFGCPWSLDQLLDEDHVKDLVQFYCGAERIY